MKNILETLSSKILREKFKKSPNKNRIQKWQQEYDLQIEKNKISHK